MKRTVAYILVPVLYVLHQDVWNWHDHETRVLGMPIGLTYQVAFCVAASLVMLALVRFAWPAHLEVEARETEPARADAWH